MINLSKEITKKVTSTTRGSLTPKSIRCSCAELENLQSFKKRVIDMTESYKCSDAKAFNLAIKIANLADDRIIKKALSNKL